MNGTLTGTRVFDRSLHKTNAWLKELMEEMNWRDRNRALAAFRAALHALRDVLPLAEVTDLGAQLPILIRGIYYENWHYNPRPVKLKTSWEFYDLVRKNLGRGISRFTNEEIQSFTRAVFRILAAHVSEGQMSDIRGTLNRRLQFLIEEPRRQPTREHYLREIFLSSYH